VIGRGSLVFGGAPIGGLYAPVSDEAAAATLQAAWDAGIRAFDTAPSVSASLTISACSSWWRLSEPVAGLALSGRPT